MSQMEKDVRYLKGVGEQRAKLLAKLGIFTLSDLVGYFPRGYEDRTVIRDIADTVVDETCCICATVSAPPTLTRLRGRLEMVKLRAFDDTGSVDITYFNQAYIRDLLHVGETYYFYGKMGGTLTRRTMANPDFESEEKSGTKTGRIVPKYRLTSGISNKVMMGYMQNALSLVGDEVPDILPESIREQYGLAQSRFAYENVHFPTDFGTLELARKRLIFEELYVLACALGKIGKGKRQQRRLPLSLPDIGEFYAALPFSPTGAQRRAIADCMKDISSEIPMNRLVQGDVGSGKTIVAAAAAWAVCRAGKQAAFMAPTEILAEQHYNNLHSMLGGLGIAVGRLTGSMTAAEKRKIKAALKSGEIQLIIGTHALFTGDVEFSDLALVITDEQHRFGVDQRSALTGKAQDPHILVMSATPIPRTLALMIYGDLDVSVIDELPPGRQKVDTFAVDSAYRQRLNGFIGKLVGEGRQVFVVCPMVEENEENDLDLKSAEEHSKDLQLLFPNLTVGCIHGKMKPKAKDEIMSRVVAGEIDILVSTTVIEVGVDVPNAALMIIENAERFGLSQLHQLRGRVGRGQHKSYCILVSDSKTEEAKRRLGVMCKTSDGFKISEEDLLLRGPGDFFGSRQHGLPEMHIASLGGDMNTLTSAQEAAKRTLEADPELLRPENRPLAQRIDELFRKNQGALN